ncbi:hypothetical protein L7F22_008299 [Adiantum nelumboides]|nr:hypothetical protein [Adiantum nelumboides]
MESFLMAPLEGCDVILGMPWHYKLKPKPDYVRKTLSFEYKGKEHNVTTDADSLPDELPPARPEDHTIDLIPGSTPPNQPPYRLRTIGRNILNYQLEFVFANLGEVALPGGKMDKGDADDAATALREAKEEIGLDPSLVKVVTTVEPFVSKKLLRVTPVIGLISDKAKFRPVPNPGEVDVVFDVPLEMFLKDQGHRYEERRWFGYTYRLHFFEHQTENDKFLIWGLTAAILIRCASLIYRRSPTFEEVEAPNQADRSPRL